MCCDCRLRTFLIFTAVLIPILITAGTVWVVWRSSKVKCYHCTSPAACKYTKLFNTAFCDLGCEWYVERYPARLGTPREWRLGCIAAATQEQDQLIANRGYYAAAASVHLLRSAATAPAGSRGMCVAGGDHCVCYQDYCNTPKRVRQLIRM